MRWTTSRSTSVVDGSDRVFSWNRSSGPDGRDRDSSKSLRTVPCRSGHVDQERVDRANGQGGPGVRHMTFLGEAASDMRERGRHDHLACAGGTESEKAAARCKGCVGRDPFAADFACIVGSRRFAMRTTALPTVAGSDPARTRKLSERFGRPLVRRRSGLPIYRRSRAPTRAAYSAAGSECRDAGKIPGIFVKNSKHQKGTRQDRDKEQPPVAARFLRLVHLGPGALLASTATSRPSFQWIDGGHRQLIHQKYLWSPQSN
jgi:hypothetical protein